MLFNSSKVRLCGLAMVLVAGLLCASAASASSVIVVDHFTSPVAGNALLVTSNGPLTLVNTQTGLSDVIGGARQIEMTLVSGRGEIQTDVNYYQPSVATVNSTDAVVGRFILRYGSEADLNADLTGLYDFAVHFGSADRAGATLTLTVTSNGTSSSASAAIPLGGGKMLIPLAAFSGIDFTSVDKLEYQVDGSTAFDASIDSLTVVPMPAAGWAGLALMGLIGAARIRKSLKA